MGGEKGSTSIVLPMTLGSPPHGRGKVHRQGREGRSRRITPAWAGKRSSAGMTAPSPTDHPRVGGEKDGPDTSTVSVTGSPPHMRGKALSAGHGAGGAGITPAWAGKRGRCCPDRLRCWDHPRMGGEKPVSDFSTFSRPGSPPRGRGKGCFPCLAVLHPGITPALAGKSQQWPHMCGRSWDHPRVGGEKFS